MALLGIGGVAVAVTSKRMQALDQEPFRHLGVEPADQRILALKSTPATSGPSSSRSPRP